MGVNHIAIILDGNRRYAEKIGVNRLKGHEKGADTLRKLIKWGAALSKEEKEKYWPKIMTLYAFSMQNFDRPDIEKKLLFNLLKKGFEELLTIKQIDNMGIQVNFLGRTHLFPKDLQDVINKVKEKTKNNNNYKLNFCVAYGGKEEIIDAVNKIINTGKEEITEDDFANYLYSKDDVDIVIRTSGEKRTSNYLPWQTSYAEWFFPKETWPEFSADLLMSIIDEFKEKRERRFGK